MEPFEKRHFRGEAFHLRGMCVLGDILVGEKKISKEKQGIYFWGPSICLLSILYDLCQVMVNKSKLLR